MRRFAWKIMETPGTSLKMNHFIDTRDAAPEKTGQMKINQF